MNAALASALVVAAFFAGCTKPPPGRDAAVTTVDTVSAEGRAAFAAAESLMLAGRPGEARDVVRAHATRIEHARVSEAERAETWLHLGELEADLGNLDVAVGHLGKAIERARAAGPRHRLLEAEALNSWGRAAKNQGRYDEARRSHDSAGEVARALGDEGLVELAMSKAGVGNVLRRDPAKRDTTERYLAEACAILLRAEGDSSLTLARLRVNHALVLGQLDRLAEARRAVDTARPVLARHLGPDHSGVALAASLSGWLGFRTGDLPAARVSLEQALASYARLRLAARGTDRLRYRPKAADALAAVHLAAGRPDEAWKTLDDAQTMLIRETMTGAQGPLHSIGEVQALLDPQAALVGWLDVNMVDEEPIESWIYVLRPRGPVRWFRLGVLPTTGRRKGEGFESLLGAIDRAVRSPLRVAADAKLDEAARQTWHDRFAPAEPALDGVRRLIVVLSPWMARAPMDVLTDDEGVALVDRFAVSYVQSPSTLVDMARRGARPSATSPPHDRNGAPTAVFIDGDLLARKESKESRVGIQARFASRTHLTTGRGTEEKLRERWDGTRPGLVQFDGHTVLDLRLPGGSALVLDGEGRGMKAMSVPGRPGDAWVDDASDGLLTIPEIEQLDLPADLVVLAACQSAGRYDYGTFMGVGEAFLRAGARSVLTSLWPVDERATVELLRRFYGHAYGPDGTLRMPLADALQRARREVRDHVAPDGTRPFAHPVYWAPFVLVGDTR